MIILQHIMPILTQESEWDYESTYDLLPLLQFYTIPTSPYLDENCS